MAPKEIQLTGIEALNSVTALLQRQRLNHDFHGVFEAADAQWAWRRARLSDSEEQTFWIDDHGPVAGLYHTSVGEQRCQLDPIVVAGFNPEIVWQRLLQFVQDNPEMSFEIPISKSDPGFTSLAERSELVCEFTDNTGWMAAADCPDPLNLKQGFTLIDRTTHPEIQNPMQERNGNDIDERLLRCSLYDPELNLAILSESGEIAGYSLYWFDAVTKVGLVEPVRVMDAFQRQGLAAAMVSQGLQRLKAKGAERFKVSWESEAAGALYMKLGFQLESTTGWYSAGNRSESTG